MYGRDESRMVSWGGGADPCPATDLQCRPVAMQARVGLPEAAVRDIRMYVCSKNYKNETINRFSEPQKRL